MLSIEAPDEATCKNRSDENCIAVSHNEWPTEVKLFLFSELTHGQKWSYDTLEEHIRDGVGPPFQTSVQEVDGESWLGYQAVTNLDDEKHLVNRVIASKVSDYGVRVEFTVSRAHIPNSLVESIESLCFTKHSVQ
jgi:hypothetical protein